MKRSQLLLALMLTMLLLIICSCAHNTKKAEIVVPQFPDWYGKQSIENYMCIYGTSIKASEIASLDAAKADAWVNAPKYLEPETNALIKPYIDEAGITDQQMLDLATNTANAVANSRFSKVVIGETYTELALTPDGERFKSHVQLKIPKAELQKKLVIDIRNEDALYNALKASKEFLILDENTK